MNAKKISICGLLTALAIVLSFVERMFPLDAIIPLPGIKLGLANIVILFVLSKMNAGDALAVLLCRILIVALLFGSMTSFLFSLFGGLLSFFIMFLLLKTENKFCSILGVSVAGAAMHNIGQIIAAIIWMKTTAVITYLPLLLIMSIPLGLITGLTCSIALSHLKKIEI